MLVLFTWKAAAKEYWGVAFLLLTVVCTAAQVYRFVLWRWPRRGARIAAVSGSLFVIVPVGELYVGVLFEWGLLHRGLNLVREDLKAAYLVGEDLKHAVLVQADLTDADLTGAKLMFADLTRANLTRARLTFANLAGADLTRANLTGADLAFADLEDEVHRLQVCRIPVI